MVCIIIIGCIHVVSNNHILQFLKIMSGAYLCTGSHNAMPIINWGYHGGIASSQ